MPESDNRSAPYILNPGDACRPARYAGGNVRLLAGAQESGNNVTIFEAEIFKGGPPVHVHDVHDETLLIQSGTLLVRIGDETSELGPGSFAWLPKGVPHAFANPSDDTPARVIGVSTPGGIEEFLTEVADYFDSLAGPPDFAKLAEIAGKHSGRVIGPPILEGR